MACALHAGKSLQQVAVELEISEGHARQRLKAIFHKAVGSRCIKGVAAGAVKDLDAPRSSANKNSSAVSKRWRLSRATAFSNT